MEITRTSQLTGQTSTMELPVTTEQISRWKEGELIQVAMPHLSASQREFIQTGITPEEWDKFFPDEDEEEGAV